MEIIDHNLFKYLYNNIIRFIYIIFYIYYIYYIYIYYIWIDNHNNVHDALLL